MREWSWKKDRRRRREKLNDSTSQGLLITINMKFIHGSNVSFWENDEIRFLWVFV